MADVTEVLRAVGDMIVKDSNRMAAKKDITPDQKKSLGTLLNAFRKLLWQVTQRPGESKPNLSDLTPDQLREYQELEGDPDFADSLTK